MAVEGGNVMHYVKGRGNCPGGGICPRKMSGSQLVAGSLRSSDSHPACHALCNDIVGVSTEIVDLRYIRDAVIDRRLS